ncbi:MAG: hypothetical protein L6Q92_04610 [Phycisphaerae bacterium]|nr:hypothetical protein [Phycisphaerae bacterium]
MVSICVPQDCPQCGYSREGLACDRPCPECGATRPSLGANLEPCRACFTWSPGGDMLRAERIARQVAIESP